MGKVWRGLNRLDMASIIQLLRFLAICELPVYYQHVVEEQACFHEDEKERALVNVELADS